jgi:hypothetical protein
MLDLSRPPELKERVDGSIRVGARSIGSVLEKVELSIGAVTLWGASFEGRGLRIRAASRHAG